MDWQALRGDSINCMFGRGDFNSPRRLGTALCNFIPDLPNDPADAEWLKERGWVKSKDMHLYVANSRLGLVFEDNIGGLRLRLIGTERVYYNPTRMTVALFEAAAREAMKHGK